MCLVTSISFITFGPNASGVTSSFPSPTTKISSLFCIFSPINFFSSFASVSEACSLSSSVNKLILLISIVI